MRERLIHNQQMQEAFDDHQAYQESMGLNPTIPDFAFSRKTRKEMIKRDGGCKGVGGEHQGGLHAAHLDHTQNETYDDVTRGRMLCELHHLQDHINRHGRNGLTESQNTWAIKMLELGLLTE